LMGSNDDDGGGGGGVVLLEQFYPSIVHMLMLPYCVTPSTVASHAAAQNSSQMSQTSQSSNHSTNHSTNHHHNHHNTAAAMTVDVEECRSVALIILKKLLQRKKGQRKKMTKKISKQQTHDSMLATYCMLLMPEGEGEKDDSFSPIRLVVKTIAASAALVQQVNHYSSPSKGSSKGSSKGNKGNKGNKGSSKGNKGNNHRGPRSPLTRRSNHVTPFYSIDDVPVADVLRAVADYLHDVTRSQGGASEGASEGASKGASEGASGLLMHMLSHLHHALVVRSEEVRFVVSGTGGVVQDNGLSHLAREYHGPVVGGSEERLLVNLVVALGRVGADDLSR